MTPDSTHSTGCLGTHFSTGRFVQQRLARTAAVVLLPVELHLPSAECNPVLAALSTSGMKVVQQSESKSNTTGSTRQVKSLSVPKLRPTSLFAGRDHPRRCPP